ncbi:hypothetical protein HPB47_003019, partial [Ixodes persulcatus]
MCATNPTAMDHCELFFEFVDESPETPAQDPLSSSSSIPFDRVTGVTSRDEENRMEATGASDQDAVSIALPAPRRVLHTDSPASEESTLPSAAQQRHDRTPDVQHSSTVVNGIDDIEAWKCSSRTNIDSEQRGTAVARFLYRSFFTMQMHLSEAQMADLRLAPETAQSPLQNGYASCNGSGGFLAMDQPQPKSPVEPQAEPSPEPQPVAGPQAQPQTRPETDSEPQMKEVPKPEPQLELQPQPKPVVCGTAVIVSGPRRSASDGAMRDIAAVGRQSPPASVERARSHSDSDERVAMLRARIGRRFEQLEEDRRAALRSSRVTQSSSASSTTTEGPDTPTPLHDLCSPGEPCESLRWGSASRPRSVSVAEVKELAYARLQAELSRAQQELKLKDEEVARLSQIRDEVGAELEELTASLFEEANNMVREANIKQATAERRLQECSLKTEVLQAEVQALKALVLTSTPSRPNAHLHPQLGARKHRRSPSNYELATRPPSPPGGPASPPPAPLHNGSQDDCLELAPDACE